MLWCPLEWETRRIRLLSLAENQFLRIFSSPYPSSQPHRQEPASPSCGRFQSWWPHPEMNWLTIKNPVKIVDVWHLHILTPHVYLCSLWSPVHFDTQVVSVPLPVQFAIDDVEEVPHADLLTGGHLHQSHSGWDVFVLWHPECYDVVTRRPGEVPVKTG